MSYPVMPNIVLYDTIRRMSMQIWKEAGSVQVAKQLLYIIEDSFAHYEFKHCIQLGFYDTHGKEDGFIEIRINAQVEADAKSEPDERNFLRLRSRLIDDIATTNANKGKKCSVNCHCDRTQSGGYVGAEVNYPSWFIIMLMINAHEQGRIIGDDVDVQYDDSKAILISWIREIKLIIPELKVPALGKQANDMLQRAARARQIRNYHIQIDNLGTAIQRIKNGGTQQENVEKLLSLQEEQKLLTERLGNLKIAVDKEKATPAMDAPNETQVIVDSALNTNIESPVVPQEGNIVRFDSGGNFTNLVISDQVRKYQDLTDRWIHFKSIPINSTVVRGELLSELHLPYDALKSNWNMPAALPFRANTLWRGNMSIKAVWNIAKTNQMAIEMGYVYHLLQRDRPEELQTVQVVSQQPGIIMNGHQTSSADLKIEFLTYLGAIPIRPNSDASSLYLATLNIVALTNYEVADGAPSDAILKLYIKFDEDTQFYGQLEVMNNIFPTNSEIEYYRRHKKMPNDAEIHKKMKELVIPAMRMIDMAIPAMWSAALKAGAAKGITNVAANAVTGIGNDVFNKAMSAIKGNRDQGGNYQKPQSTSNQAMYQRTTPNIASGRGSTQNESMRLWEDAECPQNSEFFGTDIIKNLHDICETFGLVTSFTVRTSDSEGTTVFSTHVQPGLIAQFISGSNLGNSVHNLAPCDHIANWFQNMSGQVQYKFTIVSDGFKTFRLRVAYVPNRTFLSYEDSSAMYYDVIDICASLDSDLSRCINIPYINMVHSYAVQMEGGGQRTLGSLHVFVETPVSAPLGSFSSFDVIVHKRMLPNHYTFAVPIPNKTSIIHNFWHDSFLNIEFTNLTNYILSLGNHRVEAALSVASQVIYEIEGSTQFRTADGVYTWNDSMPRLTIGIINHGTSRVVAIIGFQQGDMLASFIVSFNAAVQWVGTPSLRLLSMSTVAVTPGRVEIVERTQEDEVTTVIPTTTLVSTQALTTMIAATTKKKIYKPAPQQQRPQQQRQNIVHVTPSMNDQRFAETNCVPFVPACTQVDLALFGEHHMDVGDNLRRYERYIATSNIDVNETSTPIRIFTYPCNFGAPRWRHDLPSDFTNSKQTHLHDAFRFTRGSLNYIVNAMPRTHLGMLRMVHVPQVEDLPFTLDEQYESSMYTYSGYAENIMSLSQNTSMPFNVPYYEGGNGCLNATYYDEHYLTNIHKSLGVVEIYYNGPDNTISLDVLRAWSNDTTMYAFNGFPTRQLTDFPRKGQHAVEKAHKHVYVRPCMLGNVGKVLEGMASVDYEKVNTTFDSITDAMEGLSKTASTSQDFLKDLNGVVGDGSFFSTVVLQVLQVVNNPTITVAALAVAQVLVSWGVLAMIPFGKVKEFFLKLFAKSEKELEKINYEDRDKSDYNVSFATPSMGDAFVREVSEFSAMLITTVASSIGLPKHLSYSEKITFAFSKGATLYTRVVQVVETIVKYIVKFIKWVLRYGCPESRLLAWLEEDRVRDWLHITALYIDPTILKVLKKNKQAIACLYHYISVGEKIEVEIANVRDMSKLSVIVGKRINDLRRVKTDLVPHINAPIAKFDPFVLYLSGVSQIGKSHLLQHLATALKPHMPKPTECFSNNERPFVVPVNKYWDRYDGNSTIIFDDFQRISKYTDISESDCARLCDIKGPAEAVSAKADIESKGTLITSTLVLCASNKLYPSIDGMLPNVVQNRRDSTWEVKVNNEGLVGCSVHDKKMIFTCTACMAITTNRDIIKSFQHLQFMKHENCQVGRGTGTGITESMGYQEFFTHISQEMELYYATEVENYKMKLATILNCEPGDVFETLTPNRPFININIEITKALENQVCRQLGGTSPYIIQPAMGLKERLWKALEYVTPLDLMGDQRPKSYEVQEEFHINRIECKHLDLFKQIKDIFLDTMLYEYSDTSDPISREEKEKLLEMIRFEQRGILFSLNGITLTSTNKCHNWCNYHEGGDDPRLYSAMMDAYIQLYQSLHGKTYPVWYPRSLMPRDYRPVLDDARIKLNKSNFIKDCKALLICLGAIIIPIAALNMVLYAFESRANKTVKAIVANEKKLLYPAMSTFSGKDSEGVTTDAGRVTPDRKTVKVAKPRHQTTPSMDVSDMTVLNKYKRNSCQINFGGVVVLKAFAVSRNVFLTQAHAMNNLLMKWTNVMQTECGTDPTRDAVKAAANRNTIELVFENSSYEMSSFKITMASFLKMNSNFILFCASNDMCLFTYENSGFVCPGLYDHIYTEKHTVSDNYAVVRYRRDPKGDIVWEDVRVAKNVIEFNGTMEYSAEDCKWASDLSAINEDGNVQYELNGFKCDNVYGEQSITMCGSLIVDHTNNSILGVMSAANANSLYFNAISRELLQHYGVCFNIGKVMAEVAPRQIAELATPGFEAAETQTKYALSPPTRVYHSVRNSFIPAPIQGELGKITKTPSRIEVDKDHGMGSYTRAIHQYVPHKAFDFDLQPVFDDLCNLYIGHKSDLPFQSHRSYKEAIAGVEGKVTRIKMNTSPGYPWSTIGLGDKKKLIIYEDDELVGVHEELALALELEHKMMKNSEAVTTLFQVSHKDELLENPDKVRIIQGSPLTYSIHMRQYYMDFNYMFQDCRKTLEHCVGDNMLGTDWNDLARRMINKGSKVLVGDFSKFGPRLYTPFIEQAYKIMAEWYDFNGGTVEDRHIREQLAKRVINSENIAYKHVLKVQCGSPSGAINTVIINTMCNQMYFRTAWVGIMKEINPKMAPVHYFKEHVEIAIVGDDVLAVVDEEAAPYFNNETIQKFFAKYDIKYTDVNDKTTGLIRKWCSLTDATFLKQGFQLYKDTAAPGGMWVIKPNMENIENMTNWVRKPKGQINADAQKEEKLKAAALNCETAVRFKWFAGRTEFNRFQREVIRIFKKYNIKLQTYTFDGLQLDYGIPLRYYDNRALDLVTTGRASVHAHYIGSDLGYDMMRGLIDTNFTEY